MSVRVLNSRLNGGPKGSSAVEKDRPWWQGYNDTSLSFPESRDGQDDGLGTGERP